MFSHLKQHPICKRSWWWLQQGSGHEVIWGGGEYTFQCVRASARVKKNRVKCDSRIPCLPLEVGTTPTADETRSGWRRGARRGERGHGQRKGTEPQEQQGWHSSSLLTGELETWGGTAGTAAAPRATAAAHVHHGARGARPAQRSHPNAAKRGCTEPQNGNPNPQHVTQSLGPLLSSFSFCAPRLFRCLVTPGLDTLAAKLFSIATTVTDNHFV